MKSSNKVIIAAVLLIAIGTVASIFTFKGEKGQPFEIVEKASKPFSSIHATADYAFMIIKPAEDNKAKAVLSGTQDNNRKVKLKSFIKDQQWHIVAEEQTPRLFNFTIGFIPGKRELTIYLPEKEYKKLYFRTENGKVSIKEIDSQSLQVESDNGKIDIAHLNANSIKTEAGNGKINVSDTNGKVEARADNGLISFKNTKGQIKARTENGKISFSKSTITENLDFSADNGKITLDLQTKPKSMQLDARTDLGSIRIFGKKYSNSAVIFGSGPKVNIRTDNGKIVINTD